MAEIALPKLGVRRRRKRPWSRETKFWFFAWCLDSDVMIVMLLNYPIDKAPFTRFLDLACALLLAFTSRFYWRRFRQSRSRDDYGG